MEGVIVPSSRKGLWLGALMVAFAVTVWGVTFVNTKALLVSFSALEIQVLRFALAYVALWIVYPRRVRVPWRDEGLFVGLGLTGVAIYQLLENCAIHYTNASNVAILVSLCPVITALIVRFLGGGTPLRLLFFVGCAVASVGVTLVSLVGIREFHFRPVGDLIAVVAMLSWGFYSHLIGFVAQRAYAQLFVVRRTFFWALVLTLPVVAFGMTEPGRAAVGGSLAVTCDAAVNAARFADPLTYLNVGFLGLLASAACFVLWNKACTLLGVVRCTACLYLVPAVTVLVAFCFLGERLTFASTLGAFLIVAGVILSVRK